MTRSLLDVLVNPYFLSMLVSFGFFVALAANQLFRGSRKGPVFAALLISSLASLFALCAGVNSGIAHMLDAMANIPQELWVRIVSMSIGNILHGFQVGLGIFAVEASVLVVLWRRESPAPSPIGCSAQMREGERRTPSSDITTQPEDSKG